MNSLLDRAEKYFKTDIRYIINGGFWLTSAKILSSVASLISSVAFANLLPEETYGTFRYVLSVASLLAIPTLHGIETALTRSIAKGNMGDINLALRTRIKWGLWGGLASLALAGYYYWAGNNILCLSFLITAIFTPFMDSFHLYASVLNGRKKFNSLAKDEVMTRMSVSLLLVAIVFFSDNVLLIILAFFLTTTVFRFFILSYHLRNEKSNDQSDPDIINYGKHLTAVGIFSRFSTQLDKILIFQTVSGSALAAFFLALIPLKLTQNILGGLNMLAMPKFSASSKEQIKRTLPKKVARLYIFVIPIIICFILISPYIYNFLYPLYPESILMSQLLFLQLLLFPLALFSTAITAFQEKKKLYINSGVFSVIRIALLIILVPVFGLYGAITAIITTNVISSTLTVFLFYK